MNDGGLLFLDERAETTIDSSPHPTYRIDDKPLPSVVCTHRSQLTRWDLNTHTHLWRPTVMRCMAAWRYLEAQAAIPPWRGLGPFRR